MPFDALMRAIRLRFGRFLWSANYTAVSGCATSADDIADFAGEDARRLAASLLLYGCPFYEHYSVAATGGGVCLSLYIAKALEIIVLWQSGARLLEHPLFLLMGATSEIAASVLLKWRNLRDQRQGLDASVLRSRAGITRKPPSAGGLSVLVITMTGLHRYVGHFSLSSSNEIWII